PPRPPRPPPEPMMKIAFLTQYYPPEIGAPQGRLSALADAFLGAGHTVTVLTAMPNYPSGRIHPGYGGILRREQCDGVRIIRSFVYPTQRADVLHRVSSYLSFVTSSALAGTLYLDPPDYLMVESPPLMLGLSGIWLSLVKRCRMIFNVSDLWPESAVRIGALRRRGFMHRLGRRIELWCYRHAALVTGQSRAIVADIETRYPWCRTYHLSNGVDAKQFHPGRRTDAARAELGPPDRCIAFYAGLHGLAQGLDRVLEAAGLLTDIPLQFVLMGDGPTKADLVRQAAAAGRDNVTFLDPRPVDEVPPLLAAADIVIVPLAKHIPGATPSKLYEAMASGRPVVLVAQGEPAAIVRDADAGLVVEPGDTAGLAAALRTLAGDASLRDRLGANGRSAAEQQFNRPEIGARFVAFLEAEHPVANVAPSGSLRLPERGEGGEQWKSPA
ncbi:MAG TPA: glycosyltransferase family 4 protein, partial [Gemmatimonadales bacterium]|nr:glycosyltransferase family 4 protein [Gemmatimonadales bacterium]